MFARLRSLLRALTSRRGFESGTSGPSIGQVAVPSTTGQGGHLVRKVIAGGR